MAVRIRLRRMGAKKQPVYRVVVADSRSPRDGRFLDTIGTYNPRTEPADIRIDAEKALQWLEEGAEPTDSARSLLSKAGVWQRFRGEAGPAADAGAALAEAEAGPRPTPATPAERKAPPPEAIAPEEGSLKPPPDSFSADAPAGPVEDPRRKPEVVEELPGDAPEARTESQDPVATERREADETDEGTEGARRQVGEA